MTKCFLKKKKKKDKHSLDLTQDHKYGLSSEDRTHYSIAMGLQEHLPNSYMTTTCVLILFDFAVNKHVYDRLNQDEPFRKG